MDPETVRLALTVLGSLGGALLGGVFALTIGLRSQRTQIQIEREKAVRAWREREVQRMLDYVGRRFVIYARVLSRLQGGVRVDEAHEQLRLITEEETYHVFWI